MTIDQRVVSLLTELVAMPTESTRANRQLIDWTAARLQTYGATTTVLDGAPGRANLIATIGPARAGGLLLSGHTDVVPAGIGWETEPYSVVRQGDLLVGRGTADMKGFIACVLVAIEELDVSGLASPVHIALSYDEEIGCVGVRGILDRIVGDHCVIKPELVLIGEPTMMRPCHAHLGKVAYRVGFKGKAGHSSLSPFLPSAIGSAARVIAALDAVAEPFRPRADVSADVTVNVGTIHGGTALNVLADACEITFELRHSAQFDPDELLRPVHAAIEREDVALGAVDGGVDVVEIIRYPALATDPSAAVVRLVERAAGRGESTQLGYGAEGGLFAAALHVPVVICGPGDIAVAHRPGEHVSIEQLRACHSLLAQLIADVCVAGASSTV